MSNQGDSSEKTSRRMFTKSAITALALSPFVSATTLAHGDPQDKPKPEQDGSPITVGGGGGGGEVHPKTEGECNPFRTCIQFKNIADYPTTDTGVKRKKLFSRAVRMKSLKVYLDGVLYHDCSDLLPSDGKCEIKIKCKGDNEKIELFNERMGIKFHTGKYDPEDGNVHDSSDPENWIRKIYIKSKLGKFERVFENSNVRVELKADYV